MDNITAERFKSESARMKKRDQIGIPRKVARIHSVGFYIYYLR